MSSGGSITGNHVAHRVGQPGGRPTGQGSANPVWPGTYSVVGYGDTPASALAIEYRLERARFRQELGMTEDPWEFSEANVAVITYVDPSDPQQREQRIPMISTGGMIGGTRGEAHSEERLLAALERSGVPLNWVTQVYTERQPCGEGHHNCAHQLAQALPNVPITFSVEFGDTASQQRGLEMLESNWREQAARAQEHAMSGEGGGQVASGDPAVDTHAGGSAMVTSLHGRFEGDPVAQGLIAGLAEGRSLTDIRAGLQVSQSEFDKARGRVQDALT
jgi:hypothetical protein